MTSPVIVRSRVSWLTGCTASIGGPVDPALEAVGVLEMSLFRSRRLSGREYEFWPASRGEGT